MREKWKDCFRMALAWGECTACDAATFPLDVWVHWYLQSDPGTMKILAKELVRPLPDVSRRELTTGVDPVAVVNAATTRRARRQQ